MIAEWCEGNRSIAGEEGSPLFGGHEGLFRSAMELGKVANGGPSVAGDSFILVLLRVEPLRNLATGFVTFVATNRGVVTSFCWLITMVSAQNQEPESSAG
jgi:hypothetical protein